MADYGLTLILSGHLCHPQSADMRPFWDGFIALQKGLPTGKAVRQIVAHSWNPEFADLACAVYEPQVERHERQIYIEPELVQQIDASIRFKSGVKRLEPFVTNELIESVLNKASSRARAVQLMDKSPSRKGQVLLAGWELGQRGNEQVNQLVADAVLPEEYLYLPYSSEVDEGYPDTWMLAPWQLARHFACFETFVLDALSGRNRYLELFTKTGWPRARAKNHYETALSHPFAQRVHAIISKFVRAMQDWSQGDTLFQKIVRRLTGWVQGFLMRPPVTAENSYITGFERKQPVFPAPRALSIRALLKYFILSEGLRDRTRFLTTEDFEITKQSGQLINPQPIVLLVRDKDAKAVERLLAGSPLPLVAIYQLGKDVVREHLLDSKGDWGVTMLQPTSVALRDQIVCALSAAMTNLKGQIPVLLMPGVDRYLACTDWYYLNALMKYTAWRDLDYVGLDHTQGGRPYLEFPDLYMVRFGDAFSLLMAAGTVEGIRKYLDEADQESEDIGHANRMPIELPVVAREENLF